MSETVQRLQNDIWRCKPQEIRKEFNEVNILVVGRTKSSLINTLFTFMQRHEVSRVVITNGKQTTGRIGAYRLETNLMNEDYPSQLPFVFREVNRSTAIGLSTESKKQMLFRSQKHNSPIPQSFEKPATDAQGNDVPMNPAEQTHVLLLVVPQPRGGATTKRDIQDIEDLLHWREVAQRPPTGAVAPRIIFVFTEIDKTSKAPRSQQDFLNYTGSDANKALVKIIKDEGMLRICFIANYTPMHRVFGPHGHVVQLNYLAALLWGHILQSIEEFRRPTRKEPVGAIDGAVTELVKSHVMRRLDRMRCPVDVKVVEAKLKAAGYDAEKTIVEVLRHILSEESKQQVKQTPTQEADLVYTCTYVTPAPQPAEASPARPTPAFSTGAACTPAPACISVPISCVYSKGCDQVAEQMFNAVETTLEQRGKRVRLQTVPGHEHPVYSFAVLKAVAPDRLQADIDAWASKVLPQLPEPVPVLVIVLHVKGSPTDRITMSYASHWQSQTRHTIKVAEVTCMHDLRLFTNEYLTTTVAKMANLLSSVAM